MSAAPRRALDVAASVRAGDTDALAPAREALRRIRAHDPGPEGLHAFLAVKDEGELEAPHTRGPLAGVPVAVKDNMVTTDLPTTCASRILEGYRSPYEATVVARLRAAGAVVVGKTNMDEFAMGSSTENSGYGPTRNPVDRSRVPGGSSGGSAAAVAAGMVPLALGSDTGGSVRQPASFCGVVGLKPTYGRVSRYGLVAFASSLDQVGMLAGSVTDAAALLQAVAGHDPRDATSSRRAVPDLAGALEGGVEGRVVGVPVEYFPDSLDAGIRGPAEEALARLQHLGAEVREVSLPHTRYAIPAYYVLATAEASSNLARYDGVRYGVRAPDARATLDVYRETRTRGFGVEVKRRILLGTFALSSGYYDQYYGQAQRARRAIARDFRRVWADGVDMLFTPTAPTPAFTLGEKVDDPVAMYLSDVFTVTANLAGVPAVSIPVGHVRGLPIGGQLLVPPFHEAVMLAAAHSLESSLEDAR